MGCPSEVVIGDNLVFSVVTHNPSTGALTDADAVPAYRVYEDEDGSTIYAANMAKLDDAGTTGFYTESIACTAVAGFEDGKTYTVYITAAVGGTTGAITYGFKAVEYNLSTSIPELGAVTSASDSVANMVTLMHMAMRNELTNTATVLTVKNDAGTAIATKSLSDDGTTYTEGGMT